MATMSFIESAKLVGLLKNTDPHGKMKVRVLSSNRLAVGADPLRPNWIVDLSKEAVSPYVVDLSETTKPTEHQLTTETLSAKSPVTRRRGTYWFEIRGRRLSCGSLKEVLRTGLLAFEQTSPGTLEKLSAIKPKSKRIVAHDAKQLFEAPHLVKDYSEKLAAGWWMGTNNSAPEVKTWLERAAECAGLTWGDDYQWGE